MELDFELLLDVEEECMSLECMVAVDVQVELLLDPDLPLLPVLHELLELLDLEDLEPEELVGHLE